mgnify:CR=1 FL=1
MKYKHCHHYINRDNSKRPERCWFHRWSFSEVVEIKEIKRILGQVRRAIQDYNMVEEGDRIAVGVPEERTALRSWWPCGG